MRRDAAEYFVKTADLFRAGRWIGEKAVGLAGKAFTRPATFKVSKKKNPITFRRSQGGRIKTRHEIDPKTRQRKVVRPAGREFSLQRTMYAGVPLASGGATAVGTAKSHPKAYRAELQRSRLSMGR
jgi:hypothetical protein